MTAVVLTDPSTWPLGRALPLVRPDGSALPPLGVLLAGAGPVVFEVNLTEAKADRLRCCPRRRYGSFEEVEADGWVVD